VVICGRKEKLNIMIDYLILNWIDLGILLVLIIMLWESSKDSYVINDTLQAIHGRLGEIKEKIK
jgi:hypothetical protein